MDPSGPGRRSRWAAPLVVAAVLFGVPGSIPVPASAQPQPQAELSEARQRLATIRDRLEAAETVARAAERGLTEAEETLEQIESIVNEVATTAEAQRAAVRDAQRHVDDAVREAQHVQAAFDDRIARLYKQGPELTFEHLLSSANADEAIARSLLLERLATGDRVDLERLEAVRVGVQAQEQRLEAERVRLEERLVEQQVVLADAEALRADRALAAADATARARQLVAEQDDLEADEARLERLVRQQQAAQRAPAPSAPSTAPRPAASANSGYAWPMCAPVTSEYGPRWGRIHRGIDQGAPTGTPIRAARAGRVLFAGWQGGYGNLTLIDHGNAVTAYAHQSRFAVGQGAQVSQGQVIGYVGTTGNSTGPHLHLEIRVNGSAVNPRQYLSGSPC